MLQQYTLRLYDPPSRYPMLTVNPQLCVFGIRAKRKESASLSLFSMECHVYTGNRCLLTTGRVSFRIALRLGSM